MTVDVKLSRSSGAALHALAESYAADEKLMGSDIGKAIDAAIQPLRDVLTHDECVDATEQLRALWEPSS